MSEGAITQIIITLITICVPALVTIINTISIKRQADKHSARQSILQLILEDKMSFYEGKHPENYQAILEEFDKYTKNGGNSYIHEKVVEYTKWYADNNKRKEKSCVEKPKK